MGRGRARSPGAMLPASCGGRRRSRRLAGFRTGFDARHSLPPPRTGTRERQTARQPVQRYLSPAPRTPASSRRCSGTNGTTSTAPMRGWTPSCDAEIDRVDGHAEQTKHGVLQSAPARRRRCRPSGYAMDRMTDRARARRERRSAAPSAAMTSARRPSLTFGTHSISGITLLYHS